MVQFKPRKADVQTNIEEVRSIVSDQVEHADLVIFPEASLSGYFLEGGVAEAALGVERLCELLGPPPADGPDVVLGFYERWRRRLYNSVAYLTPENGVWKARNVHRKMFLATYGVFDEARFVEPGTELRAFDTRFGRFGMLICEEMWHSLPATILALGGAELVVVVSASPARDFGPSGGGRPANLERWEQLAPGAAIEHGLFVVVAQLVGSEGGKLFPGGSFAVSPDGQILARGPLLEEGVTIAALDASSIDRARVRSPLLADLEQMLPHLQRSLEESRTSGPAPEREEALEADDTVRVAAAPPSLGGRGGSANTGETRLHDAGVLDLDLGLVDRTLVEFIREEVRRRRGFERVVVHIGASQGQICHHPTLEMNPSSFKLRANAPAGRKRFPIRKAPRPLFLSQGFAGFVAPAAFAHEGVPDVDLLVVWPASVLEAPFQDFLIGAALQSALCEHGVIDVQKAGAACIHARADVVVRRQFE